jgi:hypothetical protein
MLSEVSQAQKHKSCMFTLIHERQIQKTNIHKNKYDHIQTHMYNVFNSGTTLELREGGKGKDRASTIL